MKLMCVHMMKQEMYQFQSISFYIVKQQFIYPLYRNSNQSDQDSNDQLTVEDQIVFCQTTGLGMQSHVGSKNDQILTSQVGNQQGIVFDCGSMPKNVGIFQASETSNDWRSRQ